MNQDLATHLSLLAVPIYAELQPSLYDSDSVQQAKRAAAIRLAVDLWLAVKNMDEPR